MDGLFIFDGQRGAVVKDKIELLYIDEDDRTICIQLSSGSVRSITFDTKEECEHAFQDMLKGLGFNQSQNK